MDRIFIDNLSSDCLIGVTEEERRRPQKVIVDVGLDLELSRPAASERLDDTVDYREASRLVSHFVSEGEFVLLESLAEGIASLLLDKFSVDGVVVRVRKERYSEAPSIGVEIRRARRRRAR